MAESHNPFEAPKAVRRASVQKLQPHACKSGCYYKIRNVIDRTQALEEQVNKLYGMLCVLFNKPQQQPQTALKASPLFSTSPAASGLPTKKVIFRRATVAEKDDAATRKRDHSVEEITLDDDDEESRPSLQAFTDDNEDAGPPLKLRRIETDRNTSATNGNDDDDSDANDTDDDSPPELSAQVGIPLDSLSGDEDEDDNFNSEQDISTLYVLSGWMSNGEPSVDGDNLLHPQGSILTPLELDLFVERCILLGPPKISVEKFREHYEENEWNDFVDNSVIEACMARLCEEGILTKLNGTTYKKKEADSFGDFKKLSLLLAKHAIRLPEYQQTFLPGF